MTDVNDVTDSSTQGLPANFETPGAILKATREKAGIAASDIARQLNLSESKLLALEEDSYDQLASDVFAQGYLRRYAKLLGMDDDFIVQRYNEYKAMLRQSEQEANTEESTTSAVGALPKWVLPAGIFALAVLVLVLIYMSTAGDEAKGPVVNPNPAPQSENQRPQIQEDAPVEEAVPTQAEPSADRPADDGARVEESATAVATLPETEPEPAPLAESGAPDSTAASTDSQLAALEAQPAPADAAAAGGEDVLSFAFSDECWVEVSNAQGTIIYADLARAGQTLSLEGEAPFSVMLGNARAVSLTYKGELVPVNPRPGNRTARLTVGG